MGLFYNPPSPPTGSNAGTPPEPHIPIAPQGNQPPRISTKTALMLVAVMASWPQDLEPRLTRPNGQQQKIAPLTLTYGQRPPIVGTSLPTRYATALAQWPLDLEPRLGLPNNVRRIGAPLTLRYGNTPPIVGTSAVVEATIVASWPADLEPRLGVPNNRQQAIAPLTLTYGNAPPLIGTRLPTSSAMTALAWPADLEPRLGVPNNRRVTVAPLTLPYGSQPQPQSPVSVPELTQILATWVQTWDAQTAPENAAWNVPPLLTSVPYAPLPRGIWSAWEPAWIPPPSPVVIAALTLPTGSQPPPIRGDQQVAAAAAWAPDPSAPVAHSSRTRGNVPPLLAPVPYTTLPLTIRAAWDEAYLLPPRLVAMAPLALAYGQPPPIVGMLPIARSTIIASWPADLEPRLGPPNNRQQSIAPLTLVYGDRIIPGAFAWTSAARIILAAWTVEPAARPAAVTIAGVIPPAAVPASAPLSWTILRAWHDDPITLRRLTAIAPLIQPSGNPPPLKPPLAVSPATIILLAWPPDLEPRLAWPNATRVDVAPLTLGSGGASALSIRAIRIAGSIVTNISVTGSMLASVSLIGPLLTDVAGAESTITAMAIAGSRLIDVAPITTP